MVQVVVGVVVVVVYVVRKKGKEGVIAAALQRGRKSWKRERACVWLSYAATAEVR